jgi:F-type H+-transporting ATPase subunit b
MQIDWLTVAAQIANFLVLVWLLQRFLYRPITEAMARREERIEAGLSAAKSARAEVEAMAARLQEERAALEASREAILDQARQEAGELRSRLEADIRDEMDARRRTWQAHLEDERQAFTDRLKQRAGHQVIEIVGRVLSDYAGSDLAGQLASTFIERLAALDPDRRGKLGEAAGRTVDPARVESSLALKPEVRSRIIRAIHDCVTRDIEVEYRESADLLLGIRLTIGEQTVEWSASQFLRRLETTLDEVIEAGSHARTGRVSAAG